MGNNKIYTFDPQTGKRDYIDFDNPTNEHLIQMGDVFMRRLGRPDTAPTLKSIYLNATHHCCHPVIKQIATELVAGDITTEQAKTRVEQWQATLRGTNA